MLSLRSFFHIGIQIKKNSYWIWYGFLWENYIYLFGVAVFCICIDTYINGCAVCRIAFIIESNLISESFEPRSHWNEYTIGMFFFWLRPNEPGHREYFIIRCIRINLARFLPLSLISNSITYRIQFQTTILSLLLTNFFLLYLGLSPSLAIDSGCKPWNLYLVHK